MPIHEVNIGTPAAIRNIGLAIIKNTREYHYIIRRMQAGGIFALGINAVVISEPMKIETFRIMVSGAGSGVFANPCRFLQYGEFSQSASIGANLQPIRDLIPNFKAWPEPHTLGRRWQSAESS